VLTRLKDINIENIKHDCAYPWDSLKCTAGADNYKKG